MDYWSGQLAQDIATWADRIDSIAAFLVGTPDADLETQPFNYTSAEVALLKSAIADLAKLAQVYRGVTDSTPAYDFRTFAQHLQGIGIPV